MHNLALSGISGINEQMKDVLKESRRLYRVSLNAMFASRKINGIDGFVEVTSLLRDFSAQLDSQVNALSNSVYQAINCMSLLSKTKNMFRLIDRAFKLSGMQTTFMNINSENIKLLNDIDTIVTKIDAEINRCLKLIRVGENLTILAKVEANGVSACEGDLSTITNDMDNIILNINTNIMNTQNYIR